MTVPSLMLGLIIALLLGSLFHLILGGGFWRFVFYLFLSVLGLSVGQSIGNWRHWILFPIGTLNLGMGIIGSLVFLFAGYWLSLFRIRSGGGDDAV